MKTAKRIDEFTFDLVQKDVHGREWASITVEDVHTDYRRYPEVAQYDGKRFYKMSYNSDDRTITYMEAKGLPFHLRYSN